MTEENKPSTIIIAGRVLGFLKPTQGQLESMVRISKTISRGTDDDKQEFWLKQIDRLGTLIESMIAEGDRDTLDQLMLTGKTDSGEVMAAILKAVQDGEPGGAVEPVKVAKVRVQRK